MIKHAGLMAVAVVFALSLVGCGSEGSKSEPETAPIVNEAGTTGGGTSQQTGSGDAREGATEKGGASGQPQGRAPE